MSNDQRTLGEVLEEALGRRRVDVEVESLDRGGQRQQWQESSHFEGRFEMKIFRKGNLIFNTPAMHPMEYIGRWLIV